MMYKVTIIHANSDSRHDIVEINVQVDMLSKIRLDSRQ